MFGPSFFFLCKNFTTRYFVGIKSGRSASDFITDLCTQLPYQLNRRIICYTLNLHAHLLHSRFWQWNVEGRGSNLMSRFCNAKKKENERRKYVNEIRRVRFFQLIYDMVIEPMESIKLHPRRLVVVFFIVAKPIVNKKLEGKLTGGSLFVQVARPARAYKIFKWNRGRRLNFSLSSSPRAHINFFFSHRSRRNGVRRSSVRPTVIWNAY